MYVAITGKASHKIFKYHDGATPAGPIVGCWNNGIKWISKWMFWATGRSRQITKICTQGKWNLTLVSGLLWVNYVLITFFLDVVS